MGKHGKTSKIWWRNKFVAVNCRAFNQKEKIAIWIYHGWHDWYLSANLDNNKNLDNHLARTPCPRSTKSLIGTTLPFNYNDIDQLEKIIKENKNEISAIKMEVSRNVAQKIIFFKS